MPDLSELLARVEGATGADREIDTDLAICLRGDGWRRHRLARGVLVREQDGLIVAMGRRGWAANDPWAPQFCRYLLAAFLKAKIAEKTDADA